MKKFLIIPFIILSAWLFAQKIYPILPIKEVPAIQKKELGEEYVYIGNKETKNQDPIYLYSKYDKNDYKTSKEGIKYYKTQIFFGYSNENVTYQLPQIFYIDIESKERKISIAYIHNSLYILTHDFVNDSEINNILFKLDSNNKLILANLNTKENGLSVSSLRCIMDAKSQGQCILDKNIENQFSDVSSYLEINWFDKKSNSPKVLTLAKEGFEENEEIFFLSVGNQNEDYFTRLNSYISYDKENLKIKLKQINQSKTKDNSYKNNLVKKIPTNIEKDNAEGWFLVNDNEPDEFNYTSGRATTRLSLVLNRDLNDYKEGEKGVRYYKYKIRFGFDDENYLYELPNKYYINTNLVYENKTNERLPRIFPQLMFWDNKYYIYLNDFTDSKNKKGILITYDTKRGLKEEILFEPSMDMGYLPFFLRDDNGLICLFHSNYHNTSIENVEVTFYKTTLQTDKYETTIVKTYDKKNAITIFKHNIVNPRFFINNLLPYRERDLSGDKNVFKKGVFTTSSESRMLYNEMQNMKKEFNNDLIKNYSSFEELANVTTNYGQKIFDNVFYDEIPYSQIVVPFLPPIKSQNTFRFCAMYAIGGLVQQFIFRDPNYRYLSLKKSETLDKYANISYFALSAILKGDKKAGQTDKANWWKLSESEKQTVDFKNTNNKLYFDWNENSNGVNYNLRDVEIIYNTPGADYDKIPQNVDKYTYPYKLSEKGLFGFQDIDLENYLSEIFEKRNKISKKEIENQRDTLAKMLGFDREKIDLENALKTKDKNEFFFKVLFSKAYESSLKIKKLNYNTFKIFSKKALKKKLIQLLENGRIIAFPIDDIHPYNDTNSGHLILISGYKILKNPKNGEFKDAFKVQNSWGQYWQNITNDGWIDANDLVQISRLNRFFNYINGEEALDETNLSGNSAYSDYKKKRNIAVSTASSLEIGDSRPIIPEDDNSGKIDGYGIKRALLDAKDINKLSNEIEETLKNITELKLIKKDKASDNRINIYYKYKTNVDVWINLMIKNDQSKKSISLCVEPFDNMDDVPNETIVKVFEDLKRFFNYNKVKGEAKEIKYSQNSYGIILEVKK